MYHILETDLPFLSKAYIHHEDCAGRSWIWLVVVLYKVIVVIIHFRKGIGGKITSNSKRLLKKRMSEALQYLLDTWILWNDILLEGSVDYTKFLHKRQAFPDMSEMGFDQSPSTLKLWTSMSFLSVDTGPYGFAEFSSLKVLPYLHIRVHARFWRMYGIATTYMVMWVENTQRIHHGNI